MFVGALSKKIETTQWGLIGWSDWEQQQLKIFLKSQ